MSQLTRYASNVPSFLRKKIRNFFLRKNASNFDFFLPRKFFLLISFFSTSSFFCFVGGREVSADADVGVQRLDGEIRSRDRGCGGSSANGDDHRTLLDLLEEADGLLVGHALDRNAVDREDLVSCKIGKRLMLRKRSYLDD